MELDRIKGLVLKEAFISSQKPLLMNDYIKKLHSITWMYGFLLAEIKENHCDIALVFHRIFDLTSINFIYFFLLSTFLLHSDQQRSDGGIMIRNIQLKHAGKYTCAVQTKVDSISIATDVVVRGK